MLNDYLSFREQRTKIGSSYSDWANDTRGSPLETNQGPLSVNIFIDVFVLFIEKSDTSNFADDNILSCCGNNLSAILKSLEQVIKIHLNRFNLNSLKVNPGRFQFMVLVKSLRSKYCFAIGRINVKKSDHVELSGVTIDKHLSFKKYTKNLCRNESYKQHARRL